MNGKHWLLAGAGIVVLGIISKVSGLLSLANEIEIETDAQIHKVDLLGFELRVYVKLKNPTSAQVKISFPFVKIIYQQQTIVNGVKTKTETTLVSSQPKTDVVLIEANKETSLPSPIILKGSWITLGMNAPTAVKEYRTNGRVNLIVRTRSEVTDLKKEIIQDKLITIGNGEEKA
ncbi:MAG TPA: hypothetical protein VNB90_15115 [Cytophagaceae bacterium]|jgi:hypothetical protein|nr:hypothetical protein [Cytophagaceae bacterium]